MLATEALKQDHRVIEKMLRTLLVASQRMQNGEGVDPELLRSAVDFVRNFADKYHHGKEEDNLFPAIERQGFPRQGGPIEMMLTEHDEGRAHVRELSGALEKFVDGDRSDAVKNAIVGNARGYARLLAQHIQKEDGILYAIADDLVPPSEHANLLRVFEEITEQTIGHEKYKHYIQLADELEKTLHAQGVHL